MKKRITLVACFDDKSTNVINNALKYLNKIQFCKVPYNVENRSKNDTLPFHITLSAWDVDKKEIVIDGLENIAFNEIKEKFTFDITINSDNSLLLFLKPLNDNKIRNVQRQAHAILPTDRYNPDKYILHSTINISRDEKLIKEQFELLKNKQLELVVNRICLFEIYPAKLIVTHCPEN